MIVCIVTLSAQGSIYETSFEQPTYTVGDVDGQDGWYDLGGAYGDVHDVITGGGGEPSAPDGSQLLKVASLTDDPATYAEKVWSTTTYSDFYVSVDLAYALTGTPDDETTLARILINESNNRWKGLRVGFVYDQGTTYLFYDNNSTNVYLDLDTQTAGVQGAAADTFYRIVLHTYFSDTLSKQQYDLQVYDSGDNLLNEETSITPHGGNWQNYNMVTVSAASSTDDDSVEFYADDLTVEVPEPATLGLLLAGGLLGLLRRKR
jgi:hypothetical protein